MNDSPNAIPYYPWVEGDKLYASALNAAIANAGATSGGAVNAIGYGADPTGVADSTSAIRAALTTGKNVYLPIGNYRITDSLTVGSGNVSQRLLGDGQGSLLLVDTTFNPAAPGVIILTGAETPLTTHPGVEHLGIRFAIPQDMTATLASFSGTTLTLTGPVPAGVVVGDYVTDNTDWAGVPANAWTMATTTPVEGAKVVSIGASSVVISLPVVTAHIAAGHQIRFGHPRAMFRALGAVPPPGSGVGGYMARYPWAIYQADHGMVIINDLHIEGAYNGIYLHGNEKFRVTNCSIGALNVGLDIDGSGDGGIVDNVSYNAFGLFVPAQTANTAIGEVFYDGQTIAANFGRCDGILVSNIMSFVGGVNVTPNWSFGHMVNIDLDVMSNFNKSGNSGAFGDFLQITNFRGQRFVCNSNCHLSNFSIDATISAPPAVLISGGVVTMADGRIKAAVPGGIVARNNSTLNLLNVRVFGPPTNWSVGLVQQQTSSVIDMRTCSVLTDGFGPGLTMQDDISWSVVKDNYWGNTTFVPPGQVGKYEPGQPAQQGNIAAAGTTQGTATPLLAYYNNVTNVPVAGNGVILPVWAARGSRWVIWNAGANALNVWPPVGFNIGPGNNAAVSLAVAAHGVWVAWDGNQFLREA